MRKRDRAPHWQLGVAKGFWRERNKNIVSMEDMDSLWLENAIAMTWRKILKYSHGIDYDKLEELKRERERRRKQCQLKQGKRF